MTASAMPTLTRTRVALVGLMRGHIHTLSVESLRRVFTFLSPRDLQHAAQVCACWRQLAYVLIKANLRPRAPPALPWKVLRTTFEPLELRDLSSASRVCVHWRKVALHFFSVRMGRRHVHDLAAETVKHAFAYLQFDDLRYAAQVCVRWRDLGIEHPGFWRHVEIRSATSGALELLAARLGQCNGRPCSLTVDIEGQHRLIDSTLIGLMAAIMPNVTELRIGLDSMHLISVYRVLVHPAPNLSLFRLHFYSPDRLMPRQPISPYIFRELPGRLRTVQLVDVLLPPTKIPAFANVCELVISQPTGAYGPFPDHIFDGCPDLRALTLYSGTMDYSRMTATTRLGLSRLHKLDVHLHETSLVDFLKYTPVADIPVVIITTPPDDDAAYEFLRPVVSPFHVAFIRSSQVVFCIIVESVRTGYQRVFAEYTSGYAIPPEEHPCPNILLDNHAFPDQVNFYELSQSLWDLLTPYLTAYTVVPRLVVELTDSVCCVLPTKPFQCSGLQSLMLASAPDWQHVYVDAADVINFVDHVLLAPQCRTLELDRVSIDGDRELILGRFDSVSYCTQRRRN